MLSGYANVLTVNIPKITIPRAKPRVSEILLVFLIIN